MAFFDKCGLQGANSSINSIGHAADNCRRGYVEMLRAALEKVKDKLGADCQRRIETNPLRVLDSKLEHEQAIIATLPRIADHLCDDCAAHYAAVNTQLELRGVFYKENWRLVRGLDYYMRTTFEITAQGLGSQNAVCGGGRYDGLVELLGGPPTKGHRLRHRRRPPDPLAAGKRAKAPVHDHQAATFTSPGWANAPTPPPSAPRKICATPASASSCRPPNKNSAKRSSQADKLGSRYALILGDNEVSEGLGR